MSPSASPCPQRAGPVSGAPFTERVEQLLSCLPTLSPGSGCSAQNPAAAVSDGSRSGPRHPCLPGCLGSPEAGARALCTRGMDQDFPRERLSFCKKCSSPGGSAEALPKTQRPLGRGQRPIRIHHARPASQCRRRRPPEPSPPPTRRTWLRPVMYKLIRRDGIRAQTTPSTRFLTLTAPASQTEKSPAQGESSGGADKGGERGGGIGVTRGQSSGSTRG